VDRPASPYLGPHRPDQPAVGLPACRRGPHCPNWLADPPGKAPAASSPPTVRPDPPAVPHPTQPNPSPPGPNQPPNPIASPQPGRAHPSRSPVDLLACRRGPLHPSQPADPAGSQPHDLASQRRRLAPAPGASTPPNPSPALHPTGPTPSRPKQPPGNPPGRGLTRPVRPTGPEPRDLGHLQPRPHPAGQAAWTPPTLSLALRRVDPPASSRPNQPPPRDLAPEQAPPRPSRRARNPAWPVVWSAGPEHDQRPGPPRGTGCAWWTPPKTIRPVCPVARQGVWQAGRRRPRSATRGGPDLTLGPPCPTSHRSPAAVMPAERASWSRLVADTDQRR
jgi:hypothetical protein